MSIKNLIQVYICTDVLFRRIFRPLFFSYHLLRMYPFDNFLLFYLTLRDDFMSRLQLLLFLVLHLKQPRNIELKN